jgi:hypothetical protein
MKEMYDKGALDLDENKFIDKKYVHENWPKMTPNQRTSYLLMVPQLKRDYNEYLKGPVDAVSDTIKGAKMTFEDWIRYELIKKGSE